MIPRERENQAPWGTFLRVAPKKRQSMKADARKSVKEGHQPFRAFCRKRSCLELTDHSDVDREVFDLNKGNGEDAGWTCRALISFRTVCLFAHCGTYS